MSEFDPKNKYTPFERINLKDRKWPNQIINSAPTWCSVDLRDGNQSLIEPMDTQKKLKLFKTLVSMGFKEIEIGFPAASETDYNFCRYLIENKPFYKDIQIEGIWKKKLYKDIVKSEERCYIPLFYNKIIQSILHKTIDKANPKFEVKTSSYLHKYTKKKFISKDKDDIYKYKLIHTPKQTVWSSIPHKFQNGYKVFISTTSYYGTFVDNCGMTQSIAFINCKDKTDADNISKVLSHPMYKFINNICRYGNFNNIKILQRFPYCNDYNNIYEILDITKDEQNFIELNV